MTDLDATKEPATPGEAPSPGGPPAPGDAGRPQPSRAAAALSGVVAAIAALATGEVVAAIIPGAPSPIAAVGSVVIDLAPPGAKEVMVALFGLNDKMALSVMVLGAVILIGAGIGLLARRGQAWAAGAIAALVGAGAIAALQDPSASPSIVILSAALQAGVGFQVLVMLLGWARPSTAAASDPGVAAAGRRRFLVRAGTIGAVAIVAGIAGRRFVDGRAAVGDTAEAMIPDATGPAPTLSPDDSFDIAGLTPLVIPNDEFYRIDTALVTPTVDLSSWRLKIHGMVDREVTLTFDELVELPLHEQYVTIACVSNEVGGHLIGNAKWTGVLLTDVLDMAGVQAGATQIVPRSVDGWTAGFPTTWVTEPDRPRDALIAVKMNDEPLPTDHGFPARLIVPGLFGYVSATKWLSDIELTTLEAFDAYWVPRGWAKEAPILTQSRIDVPRHGASVKAGPVQVAGVAWAPDRGITGVEIQVDDGEWRPATLATAIGPQTWLQWRFAFDATPGRHNLRVRATDGSGEVQPSQPTSPAPDGARGYHAIAVDVS